MPVNLLTHWLPVKKLNTNHDAAACDAPHADDDEFAHESIMQPPSEHVVCETCDVIASHLQRFPLPARYRESEIENIFGEHCLIMNSHFNDFKRIMFKNHDIIVIYENSFENKQEGNIVFIRATDEAMHEYKIYVRSYA